MADRAVARPALRRQVRLRGCLHWDLLPPVVPEPPTETLDGAVLRHSRGRPGRRVPAVPPLPPDPRAGPRPGGGPGTGRVSHDRSGSQYGCRPVTPRPAGGAIPVSAIAPVSARAGREPARIPRRPAVLATQGVPEAAPPHEPSIYDAGFGSSSRVYERSAATLGMTPRATRAVAPACASNPVALAIPCLRVVRADGGLGGYRWGLDRKRRLLEREAGS